MSWSDSRFIDLHCYDVGLEPLLPYNMHIPSPRCSPGVLLPTAKVQCLGPVYANVATSHVSTRNGSALVHMYD